MKDWHVVNCLIKETVGVYHVYKESNALADCLANKGIDSQAYLIYSNRAELPHAAKGHLTLERRGLLYLRHNKKSEYLQGGAHIGRA